MPSTETPLIDRAHLGLHLDRALAFTFFSAFSRAEYALKGAGFKVATGGDGVEAAWDKFACAPGVMEAFARQRARPSDRALKRAVRALLTAPPRKQTLTGWKTMRPQHDGDEVSLKELLLMVRRIRNNLFHGGKAERIEQPFDRDNRLLQDALVILDRALACEPEVSRLFRAL